MAEITMDLIKALREKTGAGIADCKKALVEANGDLEKAVENLRKSGIAKAEKKAGRAVKEGRILALIQGTQATMVEVLCETDFVATNEKFNNYVSSVAERTIKLSGNGDVTEAAQANEKDQLVNLIATIGENMQLRRAIKWDLTGNANSYLHQGGRIGVMIEVAGDADAAFIRDICMHIAAFSPSYIAPEDIPAEDIAKEKEIAMALPEVSKKPENIRQKIVEGKIQKWYDEVCLTKQGWFKDPQTCLEKLKPGLKVIRFQRWGVTDEI